MPQSTFRSSWSSAARAAESHPFWCGIRAAPCICAFTALTSPRASSDRAVARRAGEHHRSRLSPARQQHRDALPRGAAPPQRAGRCARSVAAQAVGRAGRRQARGAEFVTLGHRPGERFTEPSNVRAEIAAETLRLCGPHGVSPQPVVVTVTSPHVRGRSRTWTRGRACRSASSRAERGPAR